MTPDVFNADQDPLLTWMLNNVEAASKAPEFMTLTEVATYTLRSVRTIRRWMARGDFPMPASHDGIGRRWRRQEVDQYVCRGCKNRLPHAHVAEGGAL